MKKYIKPNIETWQAVASNLMAGSLYDDGTKGNLGNTGGTAGTSGARSKGCIEPLWDERWEFQDDDDDE